MSSTNMCWYSLSVKDSHSAAKARVTVDALLRDEEHARIEVDTRRPRVFIYTALSWDFLRENLPMYLVGIAEDKNREEKHV